MFVFYNFHLTSRIFLLDFISAIIDKVCLFLISHIIVKCHNIHYVGCIIVCHESVLHTDNGTMETDSQETAFTALLFDFRYKFNTVIHTYYMTKASISVTRPGSIGIPVDMEISCKFILHCRNPVVALKILVIIDHIFIINVFYFL